MRLKNLFFLTMGFFFFLFAITDLAGAQSKPQAADVQKINDQIEELKDIKMGYEATALRHEDQAERMQFEQKQYLEMRRHLELAHENRLKAAEIQQQIDELKKKKAKLLPSLPQSDRDGFEDI